MVKVATVRPVSGTFEVPEKLAARTVTAAGATIRDEETRTWAPPGLVRVTLNGYWPARSYTLRELIEKKASPPDAPSAVMSPTPKVPSPKLIVAE